MWPILLNMTREECRQTLRRLELEAYSKMVTVFRVQGTLEDNRKKLLEELRAVLHIPQDRHCAEARRVSNDQLLATVAHELLGPNTALPWIREGRRRIPLLPRGTPQTAFTEKADLATKSTKEENKEFAKRMEEKPEQESSMENTGNEEGQTMKDEFSSNDSMDIDMYPPVAMEDQTLKLWDTELITRKRKLPEESALPDDFPTPTKIVRNIPANTNQKHLNLSQIYSKLSQPVMSKPLSQSKHSYNQVSKVSTSKSNQAHGSRSAPRKPRAPRAPKAPKGTQKTKAQSKKAQSQEISLSPGKQYNAAMQLDYAGPPNTFQASYAQSVLGGKTKLEFLDDVKPKVIPSHQQVQVEIPTVTLPTQPAPPPVIKVESTIASDVTVPPPVKQPATKPVQLAKNRVDVLSEKKSDRNAPHPTDIKILQKAVEGSQMKVLSNRQIIAPSPAKKVLGATQKVLSTPGKLVTTKVIGSLPKVRPNAPVMTDKKIVVSKPLETKTLPSPRLVVTSAASTSMKERTPVSTPNPTRLTEVYTPKGIPATDLKVSAKALVLNPKSGQKMLVVPAKSRTKPGTELERQIPLLHFKGLPTAMKLVPVSSQSVSSTAKSSNVTVLSSKPAVSSLLSTAKIIGMEQIKTANLADIVPAKGLTPITTPKITNPILRPSSAKGNVIVVQKGTHIGKALSFAKNGNDMSKIIMGKNVTQLLQASKAEHAEAGKSAGNVIVLELNNEQSGRPTTLSEILDSRAAPPAPHITPDTPVLFDNRLADTCNTSSLDSTAESIASLGTMDDAGLAIVDKDKSHFSKDVEGAKDSSSVTDWEMELETVSRKDKDDDKLNSLHLDLGMSSDSDGEFMDTGRKSKSKRSGQARQRTPTSGESGGAYSGSSAISLARTLLSQLQDDGSSSNDSSFALKAKVDRPSHHRLDKVECDELTKAKEKLSEKVAEAKSQQRRIDVYSTAITPSDINLDSFAYLEESIMAGDDVFAAEEMKAREARRDVLDDQLRRLLTDDCAGASHATDTIPLTK